MIYLYLVKIGDFGISKVLENTLDQASTVVGTPYYMRLYLNLTKLKLVRKFVKTSLIPLNQMYGL